MYLDVACVEPEGDDDLDRVYRMYSCVDNSYVLDGPSYQACTTDSGGCHWPTPAGFCCKQGRIYPSPKYGIKHNHHLSSY